MKLGLAVFILLTQVVLMAQGPGDDLERKSIIAELWSFGGIQHRVVILKEGKAKFYYATNSSYVAEINPTRIKMLQKIIDSTKPGETDLIQGDQNCRPSYVMIYDVYTSDRQKITIERISSCHHEVLKGRNPLIKEILEGLLSLGDLQRN